VSKRQELLDVAAEFSPPKLLNENATFNDAVDALGFTMWPHFFLEMTRRYGPDGRLSDLLVVLIYLWDATVGKAQFRDGVLVKKLSPGMNPQGRIATSQFPLRRQAQSKWLAALLASEFFKRLEKAGPTDKKGSLYEYRAETTVTEWVFFFAKAGWAVEWGGDKDEGRGVELGDDRAPSTLFEGRTVRAPLLDKHGDPKKKKISTETFSGFFTPARLGIAPAPTVTDEDESPFTPGTAQHDAWLAAQNKEEGQ
jgi:hypothetical protein